jgi:hypothetical protein
MIGNLDGIRPTTIAPPRVGNDRFAIADSVRAYILAHDLEESVNKALSLAEAELPTGSKTVLSLSHDGESEETWLVAHLEVNASREEVFDIFNRFGDVWIDSVPLAAQHRIHFTYGTTPLEDAYMGNKQSDVVELGGAEETPKAEDAPIYLLYLADVGRNSATFAVFTHYIRKVNDRREVRAPSLVSQQKTNTAIYTLDKKAPVIEDWPQFYAWLGRQKGWAAFSPESATRLVPHWLAESVEFDCAKFHLGSIEFVEQSVLPQLAMADLSFDLAGPSPDDGAFSWFMQITGNLAVVKQPVFAPDA